jgi:hypothetical protein
LAAPVFITGDIPSAAQVNSWFVNAQFARKTANESVSSSIALQDDDHLLVTVEANAAYHVTLVLFVIALNTNDFRFNFSGPSGFAFNYIANSQQLTATAGLYSDDTCFVGDATADQPIGGMGAGVTAPGHIEGVLTTGGSAGTVRLRWAQWASGATATQLLTNSFITARRVS